MKTTSLTIEISEIEASLADYATIDFAKHLTVFAESLAQQARSLHPGLSDSQILALPTLAQKEAALQALAQERQQSQAAHDAAMQLLIDAVPADVRERVSSSVKQRLNQEREMGADARMTLIAETVASAQAERDREADQMAAALKRAAKRLSAADLAELGLARAQ